MTIEATTRDYSSLQPISFEDIYNEVPCGIVSTEHDGVMVAVNRSFEELIGYASEKLIGTTFRALLTSGSQLFYETRFRPVLELDGSAREVALTLKRADGHIISILVNATRIDANRIQMAVFDSSKRQDWERELLAARRAAETSERRVTALQSATTKFTAAGSESELASALVNSAKNVFFADDAAVVLFEDTGALRVAEGRHLLLPLIRLQGAHPEDAKFIAAEVIAIPNLGIAEATSHESAEVLKSLHMEALTAVPLVGDGRILGALISFFRREREFDETTIALHHALARQASLVLDRIRLRRELEQLAMHDQLTGLANRNLLSERLSHALAQAERSRTPMALLFLDLDGFKRVNDDLGHHAGDAVLQTVAKRIDGVVRDADIVGRFGGDEFLVICDHADEDTAVLVATRIVEAIAHPMVGLTHGHPVTTSVGIAVYRPDGTEAPDSDVLVRAADTAMYVSKNGGPGRISVSLV
jgi:diguanylate cyclase (GGDEF)-like protein/PAS domain S-box-containing protein